MSRFTKFLISGFIIFNFLTMVRVLLPEQSKFVKKTYSLIDPYLSFFSIYQDWMMFAPNPSKLNIYLTADVEFMDGTRDTYEFPRQSQMNIMEKYFYGEKYRKIIGETIRKDDNRWTWPDTAKFVLRKMKSKHYNKIPLKVHLVRHWDIIPDVKKEFRPHLTPSKSYQHFNFFTYEVL